MADSDESWRLQIPQICVTANPDEILPDSNDARVAGAGDRDPPSGLLSPTSIVPADDRPTQAPSGPTPSLLCPPLTLSIIPEVTAATEEQVSASSVSSAKPDDEPDENPPSTPPSPTFTESEDGRHFPTTLVLRDSRPDENIQLPLVVDPNTKNLRLVDEGKTSVEDLNLKAALERAGLPVDFGKKTHSTPKPLRPVYDDANDTTDPTPFTFKPLSLARMFDPKDIDALIQFEGTPGIIEGLCTSASRGITTVEPSEDARPKNRTNTKKELEAPHESDEKLPAILLTGPTPSGSGGDAPYMPLAERTRVYGDNIIPMRPPPALITVIWQSLTKSVDLVVGDLALLEPGEVIPADGIFISGHGVRCDESACTGESNTIRKISYAEMLELHHRMAARGQDPNSSCTDCFLLSGSVVLEGIGKYIVAAVGERSFNGRIMQALRRELEDTPLQKRLRPLIRRRRILALVVAISLFCFMMIKFFVHLAHESDRTPMANSRSFFVIFTLVLGMAFFVGISHPADIILALSTRRMMRDNILLRGLAAAETMASTTVICTDKTAVLTQGCLNVVAGTFGTTSMFRCYPGEHAEVSDTSEESDMPKTFTFDLARVDAVLPPHLRTLVHDNIVLNSTATKVMNQGFGDWEYSGNHVDSALLRFADDLKWEDATLARKRADILQVFPLSSDRKVTAIIVKGPNGGYRAYFKGASDMLLQESTKYVAVHHDDQHYSGATGIETKTFDSTSRALAKQIILDYAGKANLTISLCYRDLVTWPPRGFALDEQGEMSFHALFRDLTFLATFAIQDPLRPGICDAVRNCRRAGVQVKICTGDDAATARAIAKDSGILTEGGLVMDARGFRELDHTDKLAVAPRLQVLGRASAYDKQDLVKILQDLGEVVAVTGDGAHDGVALKVADVGFSLGIKGTEVAKAASDVIMMDDSFLTTILTLKWGRSIWRTVRQVLVMQITSIASLLLVVFISAVVSSAESAALSISQLLWIYLVVNIFATLSLATGFPTDDLLDHKPMRKDSPVFEVDMLKIIFCQSIFQAAILLIFYIYISKFLVFDPTAHHTGLARTVVFNAFVFSQLANTFNSRRCVGNQNCRPVLQALFPAGSIILIFVVVSIQVLIIFVGGQAFQVVRMAVREWMISLALGLSPIPFGILIGYLPDKPFQSFFMLLRLLPNPDILPTIGPNVERPDISRATYVVPLATPQPMSPAPPPSEPVQTPDHEEQSPLFPISPIVPPGLTPVAPAES
ncbi:hypothetical protein NLJ89_g4328 [Agrocybe chaxingu]|uniref:Calcium-transporting ATPase n=1 Tax=Agrocybe chaxingu TaxID=84603 RepID=A0A9W8MW22_9AGAR|nr:hypothetical protein NLJ89_g4328 [Agrocybe chaxingu]